MASDTLTPGTLARLHATLDVEEHYWPVSKTPPLAHWLCFLPDAPQSMLALDGHQRNGDFLPPTDRLC